MGSKVDKSQALFLGGLNCAQSVLAAFCEDYELDTETALALSGGMGGGFRSGEICGAVSGAVLVVGLKYGQHDPADSGAKQNCNLKTRQFLDEFREGDSAVVCRDILGYDLSTPEGSAKMAATDRSASICMNAVKKAARILEELGY